MVLFIWFRSAPVPLWPGAPPWEVSWGLRMLFDLFLVNCFINTLSLLDDLFLKANYVPSSWSKISSVSLEPNFSRWQARAIMGIVVHLQILDSCWHAMFFFVSRMMRESIKRKKGVLEVGEYEREKGATEMKKDCYFKNWSSLCGWKVCQPQLPTSHLNHYSTTNLPTSNLLRTYLPTLSTHVPLHPPLQL